jgi:signal transduction histidine kinase
MMEGVDNHWVISGDRRYAAYPDLEPGQYTFNVNVTNSAGLLSGPPKTIEIDILPPPWQSWWAYTLYGIIIVASLYGVLLAHVARNRAIERVREAERDQFRKRLARDFHDEAGNKITLISLLSDRARKKSEDNPEVKEILANMQVYVQDLRAGMRDFIWIMDPSHDSAFDTVVRFRDFADKVCEQAGIQFVENGRNEQLKNVKMTGNVRRHMLLIFKEAMYNSLKHANPDKISFTVRKDSTDDWEFILEDDGLGLNSARRNEGGHGLENMRARAAQINADIEIGSVNGSGTRVSLKWSPPVNE